MPSAKLEVDSGDLTLHPGRQSLTFVVHNTGPRLSLLSWELEASDLIIASSTKGVVTGGSSAYVEITADLSLYESEPLHVAFNAGDQRASFELAVEGYDPADRFPAQRSCLYGMQVEPLGLPAPRIPPAGEFAPGEVVVGYRNGTSLSSHGAARGAATRVVRERAADPAARAGELRGRPDVEFAHPDYYLYPLGSAATGYGTDPCLREQWAATAFGVPDAWELAGEHEVVVAVIDSGIDVNHEDLRDKVLPGYDFVDNDRDPRPNTVTGGNHGTHVAGIALASKGNGVGIGGVAGVGNVKLLPIRVIDESGRATIGTVARAVRWAAGLEVEGAPRNENPAHIINLSLGLPVTAGLDPQANELEDALKEASAANVLVVAAAGNVGGDWATSGHGLYYPAASSHVLSVGSVGPRYERSHFSAWSSDPQGRTVDVMGPGQGILSTIPWSRYGYDSGTSMAAPYVSGVAALVLTRLPERLRSSEFLHTYLKANAYAQAAKRNFEYGSGILCADSAMQPFRTVLDLADWWLTGRWAAAADKNQPLTCN